MNVSTDPRIVQYTMTITCLSEYHLMKDTLEEVFGENAKASFESIEDVKQVIVDTYADKEYSFITQSESNEDSKQAEGKEEKKNVRDIEEQKIKDPDTVEIIENLSEF